MCRVALMVLGLWYLPLCGCVHTSQRIATTQGHEQMKAALDTLIPPGTTVTQAMTTLKREGFSCNLRTNELIPDIGLGEPVAEEQGDYVYSERVAAYIPFVPFSGEWRWRVVLILKDGVVERHRTYLSLSGW